MGKIFYLKETEERLKYYYTKDEEFSVIERPDQFFLLYQLNHQDDCYDWTETYHLSLEECEMEMRKIVTGQ
jgi:hypothetical protein